MQHPVLRLHWPSAFANVTFRGLPAALAFPTHLPLPNCAFRSIPLCAFRSAHSFAQFGAHRAVGQEIAIKSKRMMMQRACSSTNLFLVAAAILATVTASSKSKQSIDA